MRITLLAFAFLYSLCFVKAQEKATYQLQGTLAGAPKNHQGKLFLQRFGSDLPLDSARLEQGHFRLKVLPKDLKSRIYFTWMLRGNDRKHSISICTLAR